MIPKFASLSWFHETEYIFGLFLGCFLAYDLWAYDPWMNGLESHGKLFAAREPNSCPFYKNESVHFSSSCLSWAGCKNQPWFYLQIRCHIINVNGTIVVIICKCRCRCICIGYFLQRVCTNNGAAFQCIFRCGYCISMRGYVRLSVRLSIAPSFHWSVGPSVGPLVRKTQFLTMTSLCGHPILSQLADRETDISYHEQGTL